ncbi:MAG: putative cytokinetic ring protein SteA [Brachybacterium sp.]|nr:putative cytokinetic ring protein SteA [Brachybacterium sp.]
MAADGPDAVRGTARLGRRTKDLTKRLQPGEIAVIDHEDIDRVAAEALVARRPAAVLNAAASISGRYPNAGPQILLDSGVPLVDRFGEDLLDVLHDGQSITVIDGEVRVGANQEIVARGTVQHQHRITADLDEARAGLSHQLEMFAENTMEYMLREKDLLLDGVGSPEVTTRMQERPVLIVVRGYHYKEDLQTLRSFIREYRPILIGVDGGADAVLEAGHRLDMIIGDMDSVSDRALTSGAELVVHAYRDGRAPGLTRLEELGLGERTVLFPAAGTSEDVAMLLADDKGASVIVAVGTHGTLEEFLDKGRAGMSSTFLTRLRIGSKLVDAKGVSRLYRQRITSTQLVLLALAGLLALAVALWSTPGGQTLFQIMGARLDDALSWFTALFSVRPASSGEAAPL